MKKVKNLKKLLDIEERVTEGTSYYSFYLSLCDYYKKNWRLTDKQEEALDSLVEELQEVDTLRECEFEIY